MFDKDGSGSIDNKEIMALLTGDEMSNLISKEAVQQALSEIDVNGDG